MKSLNPHHSPVAYPLNRVGVQPVDILSVIRDSRLVTEYDDDADMLISYIEMLSPYDNKIKRFRICMDTDMQHYNEAGIFFETHQQDSRFAYMQLIEMLTGYYIPFKYNVVRGPCGSEENS